MTLAHWYVPSFSGDLRLSKSDDGEKSVLEIHKPTLGEKRVLDEIQAEAARRGWLKLPAKAKRSGFLWRKRRVVLDAAVTEAGPVVAKIMRPGPAVLTAVALSGGRVTVTEGTDLPPVDEKPVEEKPAVAATVKRPTPSCPQCVPGAVEPASEVLLSFLTPEEHASWARERAIVVEGGLTGHRYLLAHRHSPIAGRVGRICFDLDDRGVIHFHDWSVPPEEEVLAAKLILEHREDWLRNEATALAWGGARLRDVFKNPFGNGHDGVPDAQFTQGLGAAVAGVLGGLGVGLA